MTPQGKSYFSDGTKRTIIYASILLVCLPALLLKTCYPFYRFGMFARPQQKAPAVVKLYVSRGGSAHQDWQPISYREMGMLQPVFKRMLSRLAKGGDPAVLAVLSDAFASSGRVSIMLTSEVQNRQRMVSTDTAYFLLTP